MKKLLALSFTALFYSNVMAVTFSDIAGSYTGKYGFWGNKDCQVDISVNLEDQTVSISVDGKDLVELDDLSLSTADSRLKSNEAQYTGSRNAGWQKEAYLTVVDGQLSSIEAKYFETSFMVRSLQDHAKCRKLKKSE